MNFQKLRNRLAAAATIGAAASSVALMIAGGVAGANPPTDPAGGVTPVYPHFYNGNVQGIRDTGSDTTIFMMQKIGDLYTSAGLYGCTLNSAATGQALFNSSDSETSADEQFYCQQNKNIDTTDTADNWDRTEVTEGVDDVGSGAGQNQLCGASTLSTPLPVDFARSSKPVTTVCANPLVGAGYAKDGVPIIDFPLVDPASYGASTFTSTETGNTTSYANVNFGEIGEVADGWLPGDNPTGPFHGLAYNANSGSINNTDATPTNSTAYGIFCSGLINDWGYLTNLGGSGKQLAIVGITVSNTGPGGDAVLTLPATATKYFPVTTFPAAITTGDVVSGGASSFGGPNEIASGSTVASGTGTSSITLSAPATSTGGPVTVDFVTPTALAPGLGIPYGLPIRPLGVNTASGTESTFQGYSDFGVTGTNACSSQVPALSVVASDPNATTNTGDNATPHTALENNASQIGDFDSADFPISGPTDTNDAANQAIELATSLYFESNGVFNTNPHAGVVQITFNGTTTTFSGSQVQEDGKKPTTQNLLTNTYPTARTLFNIYQPATVRASTAGFLNWICDGNNYFQKSVDTTSGSNFDSELNTIIAGNFGFIRLTDQSQETPNSTKDGFAALNGTCGVEATGNLSGSTITITDASGWANGLTAAPAQLVNGVTVSGLDLPTSPVSTITNIGDNGTTTTITLSAPDLGDNSSELLTFGLPPVLSVPTASSQK